MLIRCALQPPRPRPRPSLLRVTIFIPEFLALLSDSSLDASPSTFVPKQDTVGSDPFRSYLLSTLQCQIEALLEHQDEVSGLWRTLIDE